MSYSKAALLLGMFLLLSFVINAQSYSCRTGHVHVSSTNKVMNIKADNYQVQSTLDASSGVVSFVGLSKSFVLESGALDQAFNSKYVDVTGFSKFKYEGSIVNLSSIDFNTPGNYPFKVKGYLYIGQEKRNTTANGTLVVNSDMTVHASSDFAIKIEEATVNKINNLMKERLSGYLSMSTFGVSRDIDIDVNFKYKPKS